MAKSASRRRPDFLLIFASLAAAILIWLIAKQGETEQTELNAPIRIIHASALAQVEYQPKETTIQVIYPTALRSYVSEGRFVVEIDESDAHRRAGVTQFQTSVRPISLEDIKRAQGLPESVEVQNITGAREVTIRRRLISAPLTLDIPTVGEPAEGYQLAREPLPVYERKLRVVASSQLLETLTDEHERVTLQTRAIDIAGLSSPARDWAWINVPQGAQLVDEEMGQILEREEWRVLVDAPIVEKPIEAVIANVPISIHPFTESALIDYKPTSASVRAVGAPSDIHRLSADMLEIVPTSPINESPGFTGQAPISARFAEGAPEDIRVGVQLRGTEPEAVHVTVTAADAPPTPEQPSPTSHPSASETTGAPAAEPHTMDPRTLE